MLNLNGLTVIYSEDIVAIMFLNFDYSSQVAIFPYLPRGQ